MLRNGIDNLRRDLRFAVRQLRRSPGFTATAIFTFALGICASVSVFSFVDAALIRPLPYPNPSRLVGVFESVQVFPRSNLSYMDYLDWKRLNKVFASLSAYQGSGVTLSTSDGARRAPGARVSDDFFRTLGVVPVLGRDFRAGEDLPAAERTVILSYAAWKARYGGRADALGQIVMLNGEPHVVIGVLPPDFHFAPVEPADFWTTLHASSGCDLRRGCHNLFGVARLSDGVPVEAAAANLAAIARHLEEQYPDSNRGQGSVIVPLADVIVGDVRRVLFVLLGGAALLLLIATVNVSSLLLVRSESRRREIAVRRALGASAARVFRQLGTEGLLLVALGTAIGVTAASWTTKLLIGLIPANIMARAPYLQNLGVNLRTLGFAAAVALLAVVLFAAMPALHLSLSRRLESLTEGSRGSAGTTWHRVGSRLVVVELVTAMILLVGGGLLGKSLYRLLHVDVGFTADGLAVIGAALPNRSYGSDAQQAAAAREIVNRAAILPGVRAAAVSTKPPLQPGNTTWIKVEGRPYHGEHNEVHYREVSPGYFATLQARLVRGRYFTDAEDASKPPVAVINQTFAKQYFPGEDAVGRKLLYAPPSTHPPMEIVGIIADVKESALDGATPSTMYTAFAQDPANGFALVVRTAQSEQALLPALAAALHAIDPGISTFGATTMNEMIGGSSAAYLRRSSAALVGAFAAAAWLLGVIGVYGVISYSVSQRTREIGIRMALGAQRTSVHGLIMREAAKLTAAGVVIGVVCAGAAATLMRGLLFGVRSWDAPTLAIAGAALGMSAILASYVPAARAARLDPGSVLRAD
ncbi:MAG TPA: ABC transporter permease [Vicinamibacterales bacterium]|nr:ABC transporter permease [Vicinamibacterales bacterium]